MLAVADQVDKPELIGGIRPKPESCARKIEALTAKMVASHGRSLSDFDWGRPLFLPFWLPARLAASVISQFRSGELATARMCRVMHGRLHISAADDFLELQALDEERHAGLYRRYLEQLGRQDPGPSHMQQVFDRAAAWSGPPQAIILAFQGILEGESIRLQQVVDKWLPCPLFKEISAAIARDEARHVAFGRLYLQEALPTLPRRERLEIFRWIRALWHEAARGAISRFAPPGMVQVYGGLAGWMANEWRERVDDLEELSLFTAAERREFEAAC